MIQIGQQAPDFELPSSLAAENGRPGKPVKLSDYQGKKNVVLAFYPLDFSPVCSGEISCFREDFAQFQSTNTEVLGVSVDSAWCHQAFAKQMGIEFPLLADFQPRGRVSALFGCYEEERGIASRATVIVDREGKVVYAKNHGLGTPRSDEEIIAELKKLGLRRRRSCATMAAWRKSPAHGLARSTNPPNSKRGCFTTSSENSPTRSPPRAASTASARCPPSSG